MSSSESLLGLVVLVLVLVLASDFRYVLTTARVGRTPGRLLSGSSLWKIGTSLLT